MTQSVDVGDNMLVPATSYWLNRYQDMPTDLILNSVVHDSVLMDIKTAMTIPCDNPTILNLIISLFLGKNNKPGQSSSDLGHYAALGDGIEDWKAGTLTARVLAALASGKADLHRSYKSRPCRTLSGMVYEAIEFPKVSGVKHAVNSPQIVVRRGVRWGQTRPLSGQQLTPDVACWWLSIASASYKPGCSAYENRNRVVRIVTHDVLGMSSEEAKAVLLGQGQNTSRTDLTD